MEEPDESRPDGAGNRTALLLLNPNARRGSEPIDDALKLLRDSGIRLIEPATHDRKEISTAITWYADEVDMVIVGGGDGSLNAAAPGLVETGLPLGILPLGTANDLARTLAIPFTVVDAAQVIIDGETRALDLGIVNDHYFFNVASIGFSAKLARVLTSDAKRRFGKLGYALSAMKLVSQSRSFSAEIEHDGHVDKVRTLQISVGSGRYYGGGLAVAENAEPDDGRLDVYSLEIGHWTELLALLPALKSGTQKRSKNVRTFGTTELTVRTGRPLDVNADGELLTTTPARFGLRPRAVTAFVPKETDDQGLFSLSGITGSD
jgi:YegS/Rv2252/BmrU family lipid kinase